MTTSSSTITAPAWSQLLFVIAHARIDELVNEIGGEIYQNVGERDRQHAALHQRIIARLNRLHGQAPDAGPAENRFGDDRSGEQAAELQAQDRHRRGE